MSNSTEKKDCNPKMDNVETAFNNIAENGNLSYLKAKPKIDKGKHVQGAIRHKGQWLVSHDCKKDRGKGVFVLMDGENWHKFDSSIEGFSHPGGMQRIGDYAIVGVENSEWSEGYICLYYLGDMSAKSGKAPSLIEEFTIVFSCEDYEKDNEFCKQHDAICKNYNNIKCKRHGAASVGITKYKGSDDNEYFLLSVFDQEEKKGSDNYDRPQTFFFYRANASDGIEKAKFTRFGDSTKFTNNLDEHGYSNHALITDTKNNIYLIGLRSNSKFATFSDSADLYKLSVSEDGVELGQPITKHLNCKYKHNKVTYAASVHLKWGSGVDVISKSEINILATEKCFDGDYLDVNVFSPSDTKNVQEVAENEE